MKTLLDARLGRITMYRLVLGLLAILAVAAIGAAVIGSIDFTPAALLCSLGVLLAVSYGSNRLLGVMFGVTPHAESSLITGLLLFFILQPSTDLTTLLQVALAATFASASKYVLAFRGRHIFNPAAVGAVWLGLFHFYLAFWWIGSPILLPVTLVLAALVLYRTRRMRVGLVFVAVAATLLIGRNMSDGASFVDAISFAFGQTPLIFFAGFMLSEPLTLPPARWQQWLVAAVVGVLFGLPMTIGSFLVGPETALIVGNALAFAFGQRKAIELIVTAKKALTPTTVEFVFKPAKRLRFDAGQYVELTLPHRSADSRGTRRVFSIASAPAASGAVKLGVKLSAEGSSFKRALDGLEVGEAVVATGISGDFRLPKDPAVPLLLVAGGIGITPFASQLASLDPAVPRDIVLLYSAGDPAELAYLDVLEHSGVRVVAVTGTAASGLPASFETEVGTRLDRESTSRLVPDIAQRRVYVSGPPSLVNDVVATARSLGAKRVKKDYFSGY